MWRALFPNGLGTRGLIALAFVFTLCTIALILRDVSVVKDLALMAVGYFFADRTAAAKAAKGG